jgi:polyketide-type polyunsaturated fatty acid synthase PfaA
MSLQNMIAALAQFQGQVGNFEKNVTQLIQAKKMMPKELMPKELTPNHPAKELNSRLQQTPIAIIGIASILPQAATLQQYWENILQEVDCITEIPSSHWDIDAYYDPDPRAPDKTYCKRGGFLPEVDFNPMEFGLPPNILEVTDSSQLLSLVVAKQAMEDAGYGESKNFNRDLTGITLGVAVGRQLATPLASRLQYPIWERVLKNSGLSDHETQAIIEKIKLAYVDWHDNAFPGLLGNVVAGRIANRLDFGGTNCTVDAACASSLAAFKMAVSELVEYRCNLMVTGGVDTDNSIFTYLCFSKTPALSLKQESRPFDSNADGILLGEGIGMFVLKRLADAQRDGDRIYAVVKGIGTSSDGRFKSIYAPRLEGQVNALQRAYADADVNPASVGLVEAHGTGTLAGDPVEFESLKQVFQESEAGQQSIALGSVKSQIGHTKAAAGAASLIKVALALHHKILPPTINIEQPNPKLGIEDSPFYLNTKPRPWFRPAGSQPRRAGVSSFGFGGTNFHLVLEEYDNNHDDPNQHSSKHPYRLHQMPESILLLAQTHDQLLSDCQIALQKLQSETGTNYYPKLLESSKFIDIPADSARLGFIANSWAEACHKLQIAVHCLEQQANLSEWEHPKGIYYCSTGIPLQGKVVALFSGQGSQYLEMGKDLTMSFPELRQTYEYLDELFLQDGLKTLSSVVFPPPVFEEEHLQTQIEALRQTEYAQPAIGAFSAGLFKILQQAGFIPDFVAGHSFGELTALWAAKSLSDQDYFTLVKARGKAMAASNTAEQGAMLAVKVDIDQIEAILQDFPQVTIANLNSPQQVVLAGAQSAILDIQARFQSQEIIATLLPVSAAFHTPLVAHAQKPFAQAVDAIAFNAPDIPVYTNVTGKRYPAQKSEIQKILKGHLLNQVLFKQEIETIYADGGYCFIEFGPKAVLTHLVKEILGDQPHIAVALNGSSQQDSDRQFREAILQLKVKGLKLGNIDPYAASSSVPVNHKNSALTVRLKASNYVSPETKLAFETALQNGPPVKIPQPLSDRPPPNSHSLISVAQVSTPIPNQPVFAMEPRIMSDTSANISANIHRLFDSVEYSLSQINQHQSETLQVHSQYLNHQMEYAKIFFNLMQQQGTLFSESNKGNTKQSTEVQPAVLQSLDRNLTRFHDHQTDTLRVHQQSIQHQSEYSRNLFQLTHQQCGLLLGKDLPILFTPNTEDQNHIDLHIPTPTIEPPLVVPPPTPLPVQSSTVANLGQILLAIVSEKTGYPSEMLELEMDMEADLGIDSIRRVEILGALQEHFPNVSQPNAEDVAELRTLGQIVTFMETHLSTTQAQGQVNFIENNEEVREIMNNPVHDRRLSANGNGNGHKSCKGGTTAIAPTISRNNGSPHSPTPTITALEKSPLATKVEVAPLEDINVTHLGGTLLTIVSEKTGYPVEMLELEMDMEADLGIDSIRRVEILGALQEQFPNLPTPDPEDLAEVRTLGQIVNFLGQQFSEKKTARPKVLVPQAR